MRMSQENATRFGDKSLRPARSKAARRGRREKRVWPPRPNAVWSPPPVLDIRLKTAIENELAKEELRSPRGVLRAGVRVDFSDPELERTISLNGFGMIEPTGRWTIAQKAGFVATLAGD